MVLQRWPTSRLLSIAILTLVFLTAVGAGAYAIYQERYQQLDSKVLLLENQVASLSQVLLGSGVMSSEDISQLQEFASRPEIIAAQDEVLISVVSDAVPAVVSIVVSKDVPLLEIEYTNPFGDHFRDFDFRVPSYRQVGTEEQQVGAGTGFLIHSDGYILTNRHVVDDPEAEYTTLLSSGEQKTARVVYRDETYDLAILKIDGAAEQPLQFGDSSELRLGQTVTTIGNALGEYENSVSVGIISGLDRTIRAQDNNGRIITLENVIQTDVAINRGNSGGPLLDLSGKVIGINVAMDRFANNIAFAIPINAVKPILDDILP